MNQFALNGGALNGTSVQLVLASANIVCSAEVMPDATRSVLPAANVFTAASVSAEAVQWHATGADIVGTANVDATALHIQAAAADMQGSAEILARVLRMVQGAAEFTGTAAITVIPASTLGAADVAGSADVVASATKIQPGAAAASAKAEINAEPQVTRFVSAYIAGSAEVRVEAKFNNQLDAFADIVGEARITTPDSGIVIRQAGALVDTAAGVVPAVAYVHASAAATIQAGAEVAAVPTVMAITGAYFRTCAADIVAEATRTVLPVAEAQGSSNVVALAGHRHYVQADVSGTGELALAPTRTVFGGAGAGGTAQVIPISTAIRNVDAVIDASADVKADAANVQPGQVTVSGAAEFSLVPTTYRAAVADITGSAQVDALAGVAITGVAVFLLVAADVVANGERHRSASSDVDAGAEINADPAVVRMAQAMLDCAAEIVAEMRSNADALDPPERTLRRPFEDTQMRKPYEFREMRRAA